MDYMTIRPDIIFGKHRSTSPASMFTSCRASRISSALASAPVANRPHDRTISATSQERRSRDAIMRLVWHRAFREHVGSISKHFWTKGGCADSAAPSRPLSKTAFRDCPLLAVFPQVAGVKIEADPNRPAGNRVLSIKVGDTPLDANRTYSVATIDFMARGGDDYFSFRDAKPVLPPADSPTIAYEVIDYITSIGTIRAAVDWRSVLS